MYKIVQFVPSLNKYYSFNIPFPHINDDFICCVEYKIGQWTYPKVDKFKLYFIDTLENAKYKLKQQEMIGYESTLFQYKIFECEVENPTTKYDFHGNIRYDCTIKDIDNITIESHEPINKFSRGVMVCDSLKLIREVV